MVELAVTLSIIGIILSSILTRVLFYQSEAEKLATDQVVRALRQSLQLQLASLMARGRIGDLPGLLEQNPMDWLARKPSNYLGAFYEVTAMELDAGNWYFDKKEKKLVYLFSHSENYRPFEINQLNFKVKLVNNRDNAVEHLGSKDLIKGAILVEVAP
jgi:general secretion pathway protein G